MHSPNPNRLTWAEALILIALFLVVVLVMPTLDAPRTPTTQETKAVQR